MAAQPQEFLKGDAIAAMAARRAAAPPIQALAAAGCTIGMPALRIVSGWIHNGQAGDVESVMVDGRWLMRQLVERYPNVPFPITLPPPVSRASRAE